MGSRGVISVHQQVSQPAWRPHRFGRPHSGHRVLLRESLDIYRFRTFQRCYDWLMPGPFSEPRAAYIHVPFCAHRCGYCDFTLVARKDHLIDDYLRALEMELQLLERPREIDTLFFGGGTPTHLNASQLRRLCELTGQWFQLADGCEYSVEANPAGFTAEKVDVLAEFGVNRISLGAQSFNSNLLDVLERDHRPAGVTEVVECVRTRIDNVSLDLIFAVPGQGLSDWRETLQSAVTLAPTHVSTYGLTWERGTAFWSRRRNGSLIPVAEDDERAMYETAMTDLPEAGYLQYEISNFARPGFECRHNQVYWSGLPYFGFGPGAASYIEGTRRSNHRSVTTWLRRMLSVGSGVAEAETLSPEDRAREAVMLGLRQAEGIHADSFADRFGFSLPDLAGPAIERFQNERLLESDGTHLRLTRAGRMLADTVVAAFL
jgi:putative oxygen-independent coproporphyrinogen III oxidase